MMVLLSYVSRVRVFASAALLVTSVLGFLLPPSAAQDVQLNMDLYRTSLTDDAPAHLYPVAGSPAWEYEARVSPSGQTVAFVSTRSGAFDVWTLDRATQQVKPLTSLNAAYVGNPRWHPDGRMLAVHALQGGTAQIWLVQPHTGTSRRLELPALSDRDVWAAGWSHDGTWLYVTTNPRMNPVLWKVRPDGRNLTRLRAGINPLVQPTETPGVVYATQTGTKGLWRIDLRTPGTPPERITSLVGPEDWGNWHVTDAAILLVHRHSGLPAVVRLDRASGTATVLARVPTVVNPSLTVAPDAQTLWVARFNDGMNNVVTLSTGAE